MHNFAWICTDGGCGPEVVFFLILGVAMPFIVGAAVLYAITHYSIRYWRARQTGDNPTQKRSKWILVGILGVLAVGFSVAATSSFLFEYRREQTLKDRSFDVYGTPGQYLRTEYLRQDDSTVQHLDSDIETPLGDIELTQAAIDDTTRSLLVEEDQVCDYENLRDYTAIFGRLNEIEPKLVACPLVYTSPTGIKLYRPKPGQTDYTYVTRYLAATDNTLMVFKAYPSSGEFDGNADQAQFYITKFLKEASPLTDDELLD